MKKYYFQVSLQLLIALGFLFSSARAQAGEIIIAGIYQGKNLFVQNPISPDNHSYCANEVYVNDQKVISNIKLSAFEIDLSFLEVNDPVTVRITHKDGCTPKIINVHVIRPSSTFHIETVEVTATHIHWTTQDETDRYLFYIENLRNGNWIVLRKVQAKGQGQGTYSLMLQHPLGITKYRVKAQHIDNHHMFYSRTIVYNPDLQSSTPELKASTENTPSSDTMKNTSPAALFLPQDSKDQLTLTSELKYQVLDSRKKVLMKGEGLVVDIKKLKAGTYYLKVDSRTEKFVKK